jgi:hypothetical protein
MATDLASCWAAETTACASSRVPKEIDRWLPV